MKIGITGADGFLGFHVRAYLHALKSYEVRLANRETFFSPENLGRFVAGLDIIIHLAGVNRGNENEVLEGNSKIATQLVAALSIAQISPVLLYANSTHAEKETAYGKGKLRAAEIFYDWANICGARFINLILPHIFGEFGKPFYNSAVATFCYQIANGQEPEVHVDAELELVHAQDVARFICHSVSYHDNNRPNVLRVPGIAIKVTEVLQLLHNIQASYASQIIPDLSNLLHLQLFNTLRSYLYPKNYPVPLLLRTDHRGTLFEAVKSLQGGQTFISSSKPGVTRGNHFHLCKAERFLVLQGDAEIKIRKLFSSEVLTFPVKGSVPAYVDIPTFHTHCITNLGESELMTLFWSNEIFDADNSDTYFEAVLL